MSPRMVHNTIAQVVATYGELLVEQERLLALQTQTTTRQAEEIARSSAREVALRKEMTELESNLALHKRQLHEAQKQGFFPTETEKLEALSREF